MTYTVTLTRPFRVDGEHRVPSVFATESKAYAARWAWKSGATVEPVLTFEGTRRNGERRTLGHYDAVVEFRNGRWTPDEDPKVLGDYGERRP